MSDVKSAAARVEPEGRGAGTREWSIRQANWDVLLGRIAAGDQSAMAQLYDETSQLVYSTALRILGNPSDAEEAALDVYSQVWRTADRYRADRGTVFAWLMNMARTRSIDHVRSRRARTKASEPLEGRDVVGEGSEAPDRITEVRLRRERIRAALALLPSDQRKCIEMAFFSGLSHVELADRLGEPLGTIKTRIRSGLLKLRATLGESA